MQNHPYFLTLATAILLAGCSRRNSRFWSSTAKNPVVVESKSAGDFLLGLHQQSLLPGDSKMHGENSGNLNPYPLPDAVTFPFLRTFHVSITGETFTNPYTVLRAAKDSPWQLQRAWRTDSQGPLLRSGQSSEHDAPHKSPEPTAVGACRSAVAVHVASRRWLSFFR